MPSSATLPPYCMVFSIIWKACGLPDICVDVEALGHSELGHHVFRIFPRHIHGTRRTHFSRQVEAKIIHIGNDDMARANVLGHRDGHDADRTRPGNQHIFADHVERQGGMHGVAEGIENGRKVIRDSVGNLERC